MKERKINKKNILKIKVAIMCIATIIIFYVGTNFLKGGDLFSKKTYYYSIFDDVQKMQIGNFVYVNGFKIGKITKMQLHSDKEVKICVEVLVTEKIKVPRDSHFEILTKDLFGGVVLDLVIGDASELAQSGDTLAGLVPPALTDGIDEMKIKLNNILSSVDTIGISLKDALVDKNGDNDLKQTLSNLETITSNLNEILAGNKDKIGRLVTDIEVFAKMLREASPQLSHAITNIDNIADSLAKANLVQVIENANNTIEEIEKIVAKINNGEGDIGQLVNNDSLYRNLESTTTNLNNLIIDLKENPKRYVHFSLFGKKEKKQK